MSRMDWTRTKRHRGFTQAIEPKKRKPKGGWTHVKRQPVKTLTPSETAAYVAGRPDLS